MARDIRANAGDTKALSLVVLLRAAQLAARSDGAWWLPSRVVGVVYRFYSSWLCSVDIPVACQIGPGLRIQHAFGVVIHSRAEIGEDCDLRHGVTIGIRGGSHGMGAPRVGDRVSIGSGAQILGEISIGDGARIGAGAIVLTSVPAGAVAVGNPAYVVSRGERP